MSKAHDELCAAARQLIEYGRKPLPMLSKQEDRDIDRVTEWSLRRADMQRKEAERWRAADEAYVAYQQAVVENAMARPASVAPGLVPTAHTKNRTEPAHRPDPKLGRGGAPTRATVLPEDAAGRKKHPVASGFMDYFPDAISVVSNVSWQGNEQHNPGQPLHWARGKSGDHSDTMIRHFLQRGTKDVDGIRHSAKMVWRALALLQEELEAEQTKALETEPEYRARQAMVERERQAQSRHSMELESATPDERYSS